MKDIRNFGRAVGRKFSRFPFPDEVSPWLRPLEELMAKRSGKLNSPEGRLLEQIAELRIEASDDWKGSQYSLVLIMIVEPGVLPSFPDDKLPDFPDSERAWLGGDIYDPKRPSSEIAERLEASQQPEVRYWLWMALASAWAARCKPKGREATPEVLAAVTGVAGEVVSIDEFPLTRYRKSEQLDLDHLSEPYPR
jgi:hypothetical protein